MEIYLRLAIVTGLIRIHYAIVADCPQNTALLRRLPVVRPKSLRVLSHGMMLELTSEAINAQDCCVADISVRFQC